MGTCLTEGLVSSEGCCATANAEMMTRIVAKLMNFITRIVVPPGLQARNFHNSAVYAWRRARKLTEITGACALAGARVRAGQSAANLPRARMPTLHRR